MRETGVDEMVSVLQRQLGSFWDVRLSGYPKIRENVKTALKKVNDSFGAAQTKYYGKEGFSPFNSAEYSVFLYYLAHEVGTVSGGVLADQIYYLNKIMNGVDWYWAIELPEHFIVEHPVGSVLGRAGYGDHLTVYQGVTVGGNKGVYPVLGDYVTLYANAKVLGNSRIGHHAVLAADTFVIDTDVPDCSVVFGNRSSLTVRRYTEEEMERRYFSGWIKEKRSADE